MASSNASARAPRCSAECGCNEGASLGIEARVHARTTPPTASRGSWSRTPSRHVRRVWRRGSPPVARPRKKVPPSCRSPATAPGRVRSHGLRAGATGSDRQADDRMESFDRFRTARTLIPRPRRDGVTSPCDCPACKRRDSIWISAGSGSESLAVRVGHTPLSIRARCSHPTRDSPRQVAQIQAGHIHRRVAGLDDADVTPHPFQEIAQPPR